MWWEMAAPPVVMELEDPFREKVLELPARSERLSNDSIREGLPTYSSAVEGGEVSPL